MYLTCDRVSVMSLYTDVCLTWSSTPTNLPAYDTISRRWSVETLLVLTLACSLSTCCLPQGLRMNLIRPTPDTKGTVPCPSCCET